MQKLSFCTPADDISGVEDWPGIIVPPANGCGNLDGDRKRAIFENARAHAFSRSEKLPTSQPVAER